VRRLARVGPTAEKALGLREIYALLAGQISEVECVATTQRLTRNYAKRQLTWFQRQDIFRMLNLSLYGWQEAIELIAQHASSAFASRDD
jgi:tRNA A37 N6-isopentenylltransferase MiaA